MRRLIQYALYQPLFIVLGTLLFAMAGVIAFKNLSVEAFPDVTDTQVTVITLYPGRAAEEVEKQVTLPIEVALSGLPNSIRVFSTQFGLSFMVVTYDDKADVNLVRQQVGERLRSVDLPPGVEAEIAPNATPVGEIMRYRLRGDGLSTTDLRTLEDWVAERALRQVPGVADVVAMGGSIKQYEVQPDLDKLRAWLNFQNLLDALGRGNSNAGGGYVARDAAVHHPRPGPAQVLRRHRPHRGGRAQRHADPGPRHRPGEDRRRAAPGRGRPGPGRRRGDRHRDHAQGREPERGAQGREGQDRRTQRAHPARGREDRALLRPHLADGQDPDHGVPQPGRGRDAGVLVLYLFLSNLRASLAVVVVIPLALLATFMGLKIMGVPANLLSLGAMDFGIIVDGAVIVIENILHRLSENREDMPEDASRPSSTRPTKSAARPVLDADHHRGAHPDLRAAAPRGPHLPAHGAVGHHRADRLADLLAHPGAAAGLLDAAPQAAARRQPRGARRASMRRCWTGP
jgi:cobalt-zinc-cadmium resistance protein CzcA